VSSTANKFPERPLRLKLKSTPFATISSVMIESQFSYR
jgi:hypothetical protein